MSHNSPKSPTEVPTNKTLYIVIGVLAAAVIALVGWNAYSMQKFIEDQDETQTTEKQSEQEHEDEVNISDKMINKVEEDLLKSNKSSDESDQESKNTTLGFNAVKVTDIKKIDSKTVMKSITWTKKAGYIGNGSKIYPGRCYGEQVFMIMGFPDLSLMPDVYCVNGSTFSDANLSKVLYELQYLAVSETKTEVDHDYNLKIHHISKLESLGKLGHDKYALGQFSTDAVNSGWEATFKDYDLLTVEDGNAKDVYFVPKTSSTQLGLKEGYWYMLAATESTHEINEPGVDGYVLGGNIVVMREAK